MSPVQKLVGVRGKSVPHFQIVLARRSRPRDERIIFDRRVAADGSESARLHSQRRPEYLAQARRRPIPLSALLLEAPTQFVPLEPRLPHLTPPRLAIQVESRDRQPGVRRFALVRIEKFAYLSRKKPLDKIHCLSTIMHKNNLIFDHFSSGEDISYSILYSFQIGYDRSSRRQSFVAFRFQFGGDHAVQPRALRRVAEFPRSGSEVPRRQMRAHGLSFYEVPSRFRQAARTSKLIFD